MKKAINLTVIFTLLILAAFSGITKAERKLDVNKNRNSVSVTKSLHPIPPIKPKKEDDSLRPIPPVKSSILYSLYPIPPIRTNVLTDIAYQITMYLLK